MLYTKNGSIPKSQTDGTEGWIEVPDKPTAPDGKEVVWWYPPGWVIRDIKPDRANVTYDIKDISGNVTGSEVKFSDWSWSQTQEQWVAYPVPAVVVIEAEVSANIEANVEVSGNVESNVTISSE